MLLNSVIADYIDIFMTASNPFKYLNFSYKKLHFKLGICWVLCWKCFKSEIIFSHTEVSGLWVIMNTQWLI